MTQERELVLVSCTTSAPLESTDCAPLPAAMDALNWLAVHVLEPPAPPGVWAGFATGALGEAPDGSEVALGALEIGVLTLVVAAEEELAPPQAESDRLATTAPRARIGTCLLYTGLPLHILGT
jgi:hypothetical protein